MGKRKKQKKNVITDDHNTSDLSDDSPVSENLNSSRQSHLSKNNDCNSVSVSDLRKKFSNNCHSATNSRSPSKILSDINLSNSDILDLFPKSLRSAFSFLISDEVISTHGAVINNFLTWLDIQKKTTARDIWYAQALSYFNETDIFTAKSQLWSACDSNLIGDFVPHRGSTKKKLHLE